MKILSSFILIQNLYDFLSSVEHKRKYKGEKIYFEGK